MASGFISHNVKSMSCVAGVKEVESVLGGRRQSGTFVLKETNFYKFF